ncbi:MAG: type IV secretion protein IcmC [Coxiellaceae bacterium]|nr:type IV secretion protein IcmC [Coxiellaceae bacterium]
MITNVEQYASNMINNLQHFASILQILSIAGGLALFVGALFEFKRYGEMRTFMSHQMTIARPLCMMLGGVMLLIMPLIITTGMLAFWGYVNPMQYSATSSDGWAPLMPVIIMFVKVVGVFAFIRGIFLISRCGQQGQPGQLSKALLHMFGGILCINIVATEQLLHALLPI